MNTAGDSRDDGEDDRKTVWAAGLRARYDEVAQEPLPDRFRELLGQLQHAEARER